MEPKYPMDLDDIRNLVKYGAGIVMAVCICLDNNDFAATHSDALFGAYQLFDDAIKALDSMRESEAFENSDTC